MKIEDLNLDVRTYNAVRRAGCTTVEELRQMISDDPDSMKRQLGFATFDRIEEELLAVAQGDMQEPAVVVSTDYTRAVSLTRSIIANAQAAQQSLYEVCKGLKEMRDGKLYKELGYQNFEDYTENEVGIKKVQAYNFVAIASNLSADYVQSIEQIGTTKLALLAKLDEPTREAVTETVDVESVTVRELRNEINRITSENADLGQKLDAAQETIANKDKQFRQAMDSKNNELTEVKAGWKRRSDTLLEKIAALRKELEEAKAEPQEVAVEDTSRVEELQKQLEQAQSELADANAKLAERPMVQEALPNDSDARRRGEYSAISNAMIDALDNLMDFLEDNDHCSNFSYFANRAKDKLREYNSRINEMIAETKEETLCQ